VRSKPVGTQTAPRFLFLGFLVPATDIDRTFAGETHPQLSAVRYQPSLLRALASTGATIDALTTPPIAAYPRNHRWWVPQATYAVSGVPGEATQIAGPNLPGLRPFVRLVQFVRHGLAALRSPCDGIIIYSVHTPLVIASLLLKWRRAVPVFVFIPDLPMFMGGPTNQLKRLLKRVDNAIVRRLVANLDGAFPITERIGLDWLDRGPRYFAVEGVSDEVASTLSQARAHGGFVFRGRPRPQLLYTGALAQVTRFARAFHASSIDACVVFMGGGEELQELQRLSAADERIIVKPFATGEAFSREVEAADFLLNPRDPDWPGSAYSFPSKLLEYLRTGKPIISTRLGGIPAEYFAVFRPIDLRSQQAFDVSLGHALQPDDDLDSIWTGAERLAARLTSASVGTHLLAKMRAWTA
jgi:glycosyltransferase involved in cell wall biosynthesis